MTCLGFAGGDSSLGLCFAAWSGEHGRGSDAAVFEKQYAPGAPAAEISRTRPYGCAKLCRSAAQLGGGAVGDGSRSGGSKSSAVLVDWLSPMAEMLPQVVATASGHFEKRKSDGADGNVCCRRVRRSEIPGLVDRNFRSDRAGGWQDWATG